MKKTIISVILAAFVVGCLVGCVEKTPQKPSESESQKETQSETEVPAGSESEDVTEVPTATEEPAGTETSTATEESAGTEVPGTTEEPTETETENHVHSYTESVTTKETCTDAGVKTFTCTCGDAYTEEIAALGHKYGEYIYNNDATFSKDGTKTATCEHCGDKKTKTATGTKKTYTYTEMNQVMYIIKDTYARSLPASGGKKREELREMKAVQVTGKCNETGWYRITYNNRDSYVDGSCIAEVRQNASAFIVWDGYKDATAEQLSKYTFTEMDEVWYPTSGKSLFTLPNADYIDTNCQRVGYTVKYFALHITGLCNETGWYRMEQDGRIFYVAPEPGMVDTEAFYKELPVCDKPDLGYKIGSQEWHDYWDGVTYAQFYYATAQHLKLEIHEVGYYAHYPNHYVIGSYADITVGTVTVKGEY